MSLDVTPVMETSYRSGYDALLYVVSTIWKKHRDGPLPDPGDELIVHHELPGARVVSVVESRESSRPAALLRFPPDHTPLPASRHRFEQVLLRQGWTREAPPVPPR